MWLFQKQASKGVFENSFHKDFEEVLRKTSVMKSFFVKNGLVTDILRGNKKICNGVLYRKKWFSNRFFFESI